jgi:hypothetical protein
MLILGMYWIEPYFTKPADVVINGLVVFISTSTLTDPPNSEWWSVLRYFSLGCILAAFLVVWAGSPAVAGNDTSILKRTVYLLVVRLGSATVLFSAVFLLALFSYLNKEPRLPRWMLGFWVVLLVAKHLDIDGLVRSLVSTLRGARAEAVGRLSRFAHPNVARFEVLPGHECARGSLVAFTSSGSPDSNSLLAVVVGHRTAPTRIEAEAVLLDSQFAEGALDSRQVVVKVDPKIPEIRERLSRTLLGRDLDAIIGFAFRPSEIRISPTYGLSSAKRPQSRKGISLGSLPSVEPRFCFRS